MNSIYIPNIFRVNSILKLEEKNSISDIPYHLNFNLNDDIQLQALLQYSFDSIIENILIFDIVYVDFIILPIVIDMMYKVDYKATIDIIKRGCISFINCPELIISSVKRDNYHTLACSIGKEHDLNDIDTFEKIILEYGCEKSKLKPYLKYIYKNAKNTSIDIKTLGIEVVEKLDLDLKSKKYSKLGIGINGNYLFQMRTKEFSIPYAK